MSSNQQGRINAEDIIVNYLLKKDINATNSFTAFPPDENTENRSEEEIEKRILDGVLVTKLGDDNSREIRGGGSTYYQPVTYR